MKSIKLFVGTVALVLGATSIATWAADAASEKGEKAEKAEKPDKTDSETKGRKEPVCGHDE